MTDEVIQEQNDVLEQSQEQAIINGFEENKTKEKNSFEPKFTIREMLEAGVHFGHRTARWNAKMSPYIYGVKNELHIIDLTQSAILLAEASKILREIVKRHGKILFVCTKKQGTEIVKEVASNCGQHYVTYKWLGGMLTNWKTISKSIKTLKDIQKELEDESSSLTKKEKLMLTRQKEKLENQLGGIKEMNRLPDLIFVIDTPREALSIYEAKSLGIPVMAIVDTNSNPDLIDYPIPGNDDSIKAIKLYMKIIEQALQNALQNISEEVKMVKKDDTKKISSKRPSKNFEKSKEDNVSEEKDEKSKKPAQNQKLYLAKQDEKLPIVKEEVKTPAINKEVKTLSIKEEVKTPAITENK